MSAFWERLLEAAGCKTQAELAEFFGVGQSAVSEAKKRGSIPPKWQLRLLEHKGISPKWLTTGIGPKMLVPEYVDANTENDVINDNRSCLLTGIPSQELINELVRRFPNITSRADD